jgi:hypothetical protein
MVSNDVKLGGERKRVRGNELFGGRGITSTYPADSLALAAELGTHDSSHSTARLLAPGTCPPSAPSALPGADGASRSVLLG